MIKNINNLKRLKELDTLGIIDSKEARKIALNLYEQGFPSHNCYWNDKFYIAIRFNLDKRRKKEAIIGSIFANGRHGYFEQQTHFGFDNRRLLRELGVPLKLIPLMTGEPPCYQYLDEKVIKTIAERLGINYPY